MKKYFFRKQLSFLFFSFSFLFLLGHEAKSETKETKCHMNFTLKTWSVFYKSGKGQGTIRCDNSQKSRVKISVHGGGLTFGKGKILDGYGTFSKVHAIKELYGAYATAEAHGGVVKSGTAQALTKGEVSLALSGTGKGVDIGIDFGQFKITPY